VALLVIGCPFLSFSQTTELRVRDLEQQAKLAISQGRLDAALINYQQALFLRPKSARLSTELGEVFADIKQFPQAIEAFQTALKLEPANEEATLGLARVYREVYNYDECRRLLQQAVAGHPKSGRALVELGKLDIHLQHYDNAIAELTKAVRRDPSFVAAHVNLGVAYEAKGDQDKALQQFADAILRDPKSASAYYFRGLLYADRDDNQRAYSDAHEAHTLDPSAIPARLLLAKVATRVGKCSEAVDLLKPLTESKTSEPENIYLLSRAYQCSQQPELARQAHAEFEARSKQDQDERTRKMEADHLATQAGEFALKNQLAPAMALISQALEKDPENAPTHALLAKIDFSKGEIGKAREDIDVALGTDSYNPDYLYVSGKILAKQGNLKGALLTFQKVALMNPRESDAYYEMAQIYEQMGEREQAVQAMKTAVKLSPDDQDYRKALTALISKAER
jgi:tetratricopeptide (TPR) repeat protein